jgi:hypothetical protein
MTFTASVRNILDTPLYKSIIKAPAYVSRYCDEPA